MLLRAWFGSLGQRAVSGNEGWCSMLFIWAKIDET